jgi:hypothetical protein
MRFGLYGSQARRPVNEHLGVPVKFDLLLPGLLFLGFGIINSGHFLHMRDVVRYFPGRRLLWQSIMPIDASWRKT